MRIVHVLAGHPPSHPTALLGVLEQEIRGTDHDLATPAAPGLLAAIDQHAAAVRDALSPGAGPLDPGDLAAYARGVVTVAAGWNWPDVPAQAQWWLHLRLASVWHLAQSHAR